jgi:hypothetical protein
MLTLDAQKDFLHRHNVAAMGHTNQTLLDHLTAVRDMLAAWGNPPDILAAGLFHSVYGTESFRQVALPPALRPAVVEVIGETAEGLAYTFGAMEKATFDAAVSRGVDFWVGDRHTGGRILLPESQWRGLCEVVVANWLEQRPRVAPEKKNLKTEMFRRIRQWISPSASTALSAAYGFQ